MIHFHQNFSPKKKKQNKKKTAYSLNVDVYSNIHCLSLKSK